MEPNGLELSGLSGITLYRPTELVVAARAGTKVADVLDGKSGTDADEPFTFVQAIMPRAERDPRSARASASSWPSASSRPSGDCRRSYERLSRI